MVLKAIDISGDIILGAQAAEVIHEAMELSIAPACSIRSFQPFRTQALVVLYRTVCSPDVSDMVSEIAAMVRRIHYSWVSVLTLTPFLTAVPLLVTEFATGVGYGSAAREMLI